MLFGPDEVVTVWATDPASHIRLAQAYDGARGLTDPAAEGVEPDHRIVAWRRRAREFCTRWREELMTPQPGTLLAPLEFDVDDSVLEAPEGSRA